MNTFLAFAAGLVCGLGFLGYCIARGLKTGQLLVRHKPVGMEASSARMIRDQQPHVTTDADGTIDIAGNRVRIGEPGQRFTVMARNVYTPGLSGAVIMEPAEIMGEAPRTIGGAA